MDLKRIPRFPEGLQRVHCVAFRFYQKLVIAIDQREGISFFHILEVPGLKIHEIHIYFAMSKSE